MPEADLSFGTPSGTEGAFARVRCPAFSPRISQDLGSWCYRLGAELLRAGWARALWGAPGRSCQEHEGHVPTLSPGTESWDGRAARALRDLTGTETEFEEELWLAEPKVT